MIYYAILHGHPQVEETEKKLKHKIRPYNAYLKAIGLDYLAVCPHKELHQFLIGLYGEYIIPVLRSPDLVTSKPGAQLEITKHLISNEMLACVWTGLRDRLSAVDSSFSMEHVKKDYADHFTTGDGIRFPLLLLPFLLRNLIAPEVSEGIMCYTRAYM